MDIKEKVTEYFKAFNDFVDCPIKLLCWYNNDFILLQHVGHPSYVSRIEGVVYCTSYFILIAMDTVDSGYLKLGTLSQLPKDAIYYYFEGRLTKAHKKIMEEITKTEIIINKMNLYEEPLI